MSKTKMKCQAAVKLLHELPLIEDRLRRAGLMETAVLMNKAVQKSGFEVAAMLDALTHRKP